MRTELVSIEVDLAKEIVQIWNKDKLYAQLQRLTTGSFVLTIVCIVVQFALIYFLVEKQNILVAIVLALAFVLFSYWLGYIRSTIRACKIILSIKYEE